MNSFRENDITWNNCIELCTDGAHSIFGHKAGLHALVKKKAPHASHNSSSEKNMSEELNDI